MSKKKIEIFVERFEDFHSWKPNKQIDYFAYFLIKEDGLQNFTAKQINDCFVSLDLKVPNRTSAYLSENSVSRKGKYIKCKPGYRLERQNYNDINQLVKNEPKKVQVSQQLVDLVTKVKSSGEKAFLTEALGCYRVEAYRATIIMIWILAMSHLYEYIFTKKLKEFNNALAKNPDKKIKKIVNIDDFSDLREEKFIELTRAAKIISNDVRKILDVKLGIRNSAAHPSGVVFSGHKATEFSLDMINNVILKY